MRKSKTTLFVVLAALAILLGGGLVFYKTTFPYGQSHCCIIGMMGALYQYAEENDGRFPAGETSAEAALSLLYKSNYIDAYSLRGMTVPEKTVRSILEGGGLLGPDSCGWHYEPGLTRADNPRLALLWCKNALGHNGQRAKDGGRQVVFIGRGIERISGAKWAAFLEEQNQLLQQRSARAVSGLPLIKGIIELPDGTLQDEFEGHCTTREETKGPDSSGTVRSLDTGCQLLWYVAPIQDGTVTRTLSFANLESDPVTITFKKGIPNITNFVYKMRSKP